MFEEEQKKQQPPSSDGQAEQSGKQQESGQSIHTMPMEYYMGEKTSQAGAETAKQKPTAAPAAEPKQEMRAMPQTQAPAVKKSGAGKIVIIIFLIALIIGSGYLLYQTYLAPTEPAVQLTEEPTQEQPATIEEEQEVIEEEEVTEIVEEQEVPETAEPKEFDPADLNRFSLSILSSTDTDKDGLTDYEETLLGTDMVRVDSDNDTYRDSLELENLYSPIDFAPTRLSDTNLVKVFENRIYNYKFMYPAEWLAEALDSDDPMEIMVSSAATEFINIIIEQKMPDEDILDWYLRQAPLINKNQIRKYKTSSQLTAVESPDGFTAYIDKDDYVYIIHYNIGLKEEANFPNLFKLIVNSFEFVGEEMEEENANSRSATENNVDEEEVVEVEEVIEEEEVGEENANSQISAEQMNSPLSVEEPETEMQEEPTQEEAELPAGILE